MLNRATRILNRLQDAPVLLVEPGFVVESRISHGIHGDEEDLAWSVKWRDNVGCQWTADFSEGALAKATIAGGSVAARDFEGAEVVFQLYRPEKRINLSSPRTK
jgi:hypothetical protein